MGLSLRGVVAALNRVQERLEAGVPERERAFFLDEVAAVVCEIEEACAGCDATPDDLSPRSRNAYRILRDIAAIPPAELPAPTGAGSEEAPSEAGTSEESRPEPAPPQLRIRRVVKALNRTLDALASAVPGSAGVRSVAESVRRTVEGVERICEDESTPPSALPPQTAQAYAMLKWLDEEGNLARYLDRRDAALAAIRAGIDGLDPLDEFAVRIAAKKPALIVRFDPGRHVYRMNGRGDHLVFRLGLGFLSADDEDLRRLAEVLLRRKRVSDHVRSQYQAFVDSEDYGLVQTELELILGGATYRPQGRVYDLDQLFDRLNERFFDGRMLRPYLDWRKGGPRTRFGLYVPARDLACVDARLDDASVPEFAAEFVLYHELLHKKHGAVVRGGRRHVHTAAFRADEQRHPQRAEAEIWLDRLVHASRGRRP